MAESTRGGVAGIGGMGEECEPDVMGALGDWRGMDILIDTTKMPQSATASQPSTINYLPQMNTE